MSTLDLSKTREARRAATLAARESAPRYGDEQRVQLADVRPGDYLVMIPTQHHVRGMRYGTLVTGLRMVHAGERVQTCGPLSVTARTTGYVVETAAGGAADVGSAIWPTTFDAIVRRVEL